MKLKKIISGLMALTVSLCYMGQTGTKQDNEYLSVHAICCCKNNFDKTKYTLSGDMAKDVATIAKSQNGKKQAQLGYNEAWCDEYAADCIENAGAGSDIVGHGGTVGDFLKVMKDKGMQEVKSPDTPKAGDLVFYYNPSTKGYPHVAIMTDSVNSAHGNCWPNGYSQVYCMNYKDYCDTEGRKVGSGLTAIFMRPAYKSTSYTVTFNANGGKCTTANKKVTKGSTYGTLPMPTKPGYSFTGWFTAATGGTKVAATTTVSLTANQTLYAQWTPAKPSWTPYQFKGSGTQADPYQISSAAELVEMQKVVNSQYYNPTYGKAYYIQTADIDLSGIDWIPIGLSVDDSLDGVFAMGEYNSATRQFCGHYNGDNHVISNLKVTNYIRTGLFGHVRNGSIRNLVVMGDVSSVKGAYMGGIAGCAAYNEVIDSCAFIGNVSSSDTETTNVNVGGIVGQIWNGGKVSNCYHTGKVNSTNYAGGIAGDIVSNSAGAENTSVIENCYHANGTIAGKVVGGITALAEKRDNITAPMKIVNCYVASDSAANVDIKGADTNTASLKTKTEMLRIADVLGETFKNNKNSELNSGYPVFPWQIITVEGDCNSDGEFGVADVVMLQKYIIKADTKLTDWETADLCKDGVIDIFDLTFMKKMIYTRDHLSDWVLESNLPAGAKVVDTKWTYDKTTVENKTSETALTGWNLVSSGWEKSTSGTHLYAAFPSGFDTTNAIYKKYNKSALKASESETAKREVSAASVKSYIYWHWNYLLGTPGPLANRLISDEKGTFTSGSSTYSYTHFSAFESTTNIKDTDSSGNYFKYDTGVYDDVSWWWIKLPVYQQTYTDYKKIYNYTRTVVSQKGAESETDPTGAENIQNIQKWVRYSK